MKFSQRIGITPIKKEIQLNSIDTDLKNGLWNIYHDSIFLHLLGNNAWGFSLDESGESYARHLWHNLFKLPIDKIPGNYKRLGDYLRDYFFKCEWHQLYDLIEESLAFLVRFNIIRNGATIEGYFNSILEREFAGYRFVSGNICPITNTQEMIELEDVLSITGSFSALKGCNIHLSMALNKLSDKLNPDYRNSIKESISAVESMAKIISGRQNDTLGASLDRIKGTIKLHNALEKGFKQLYGYTSDEGGIRHALMDSPNCDFEDAKYMLVSCSAFINYLISKAIKAGVTFQ